MDPMPFPSYKGAANINKVVMRKVPHTGSLEPFQKLVAGLWLPTIVYIKPESAFTMPALYELLPLEQEKVFISPAGSPLEVSLYDEENWIKYG